MLLLLLLTRLLLSLQPLVLCCRSAQKLQNICSLLRRDPDHLALPSPKGEKFKSRENPNPCDLSTNSDKLDVSKSFEGFGKP